MSSYLHAQHSRNTSLGEVIYFICDILNNKISLLVVNFDIQ